MKKAALFLAILNITLLNAQNSWKKLNSNSSKLLSSKTKLDQSQFYSLDINSFKESLKNQKQITLPNSLGEFSNFYIKETSNFTKALAKKYTTINSYSIRGIDDTSASGKLSIGSDGIHIIMFSGKQETLFITPDSENKTTYIAHAKGTLNDNTDKLTCLLDDETTLVKKTTTQNLRNADDATLRTYKLALACTGEYAQFHINNQGIVDTASDTEKEEAVLSAMNTTITTVNAIFEKDLAVNFNIVLNNSGENELIFLDADSDNLSNDDASSLISESQSICDDIIGTNNYDIGHTFSTGAGGLAGLAVVCLNGQKGKGVTGRTSPIGDSYDIDYVAHEIGHQFGAPHTFNNSCDSNRSSANAVEPGSGSTIMAYAGICAPNIQNNSDDYFHAISIASMWNVIENTSCATQTNTNNNAPIINTLNNYSVPKSTPLILKGEASDIDNDALTYCWEQLDNEIATMPPLSTSIAGPSFRSLPPSDSGDRYLPTLATVVNGSTANEWEVIPDVARELNFSLTVRDNNINGGATAREDITISVIDTDAFSVNTPDNSDANTNQTITWNIGETNNSPINCNYVNIKLSIDGGNTFPYTLIENTDNDGTQNVLIPSVASTSNAIILVEANDNIFYNISNQFDIVNDVDISLTNTTGEITICKNNQVTYEINYVKEIGFSETIDFSITDKPIGTKAIVSPSSLSETGTVLVTVSDLSDLNDGDYSFTLTSSSPSIIKNISLPLQKISNYCDSNGYSTDFDNTSILEVNFNEITNISTKNISGYSDFKNISTTVNRGELHELIVNINTDGNYLTQTKVWIDWNQNCSFDLNEEYDLGQALNVSNDETSNSPLEINIPNDAEFGSTTMRIITKYTISANTDYPTSCEIDFYGETEDYTIIVNSPTAAAEDITFSNFNLYPNPSKGIFNLNFVLISNTEEVLIKVIDINGRTINKRTYNNTSTMFSEELNFNNLNTGLYLLQIINGDKQTMKKIIIE